MIPVSGKEAEKIANEIIKDAKYEEAGGLDSSIDEEELKQELRDQVVHEDTTKKMMDDLKNEIDDDVEKNIDLTYYAAMNIDQKLSTL